MIPLPVYEVSGMPEFDVFFSMIINFGLISLGVKIVIDLFKFT